MIQNSSLRSKLNQPVPQQETPSWLLQHLCNLTSFVRTHSPYKYANTATCSHTLKHVKPDQAAAVTAGTNTCPTTPKCTTALGKRSCMLSGSIDTISSSFASHTHTKHTHTSTHSDKSRTVCIVYCRLIFAFLGLFVWVEGRKEGETDTQPSSVTIKQHFNIRHRSDSFTPYSIQQPGTDKSSRTHRTD